MRGTWLHGKTILNSLAGALRKPKRALLDREVTKKMAKKSKEKHSPPL